MTELFSTMKITRFIGILGCLLVSANQNKNNNELLTYCGDDIKEFCPGNEGFVLYCLYENKGKLSSECQNYLGTTVIGGCNEEAETLCGDFTENKQIISCLRNHTAELSSTCQKNLENQNSPLGSAAASNEQATKAVTVISFIYLLIPVSLFIWAFYQMNVLYQQQKEVFEDKGTKKVSDVAVPNRIQKGNERFAWNVGFYKLSYYSLESSWKDPFNERRRKITREVRI